MKTRMTLRRLGVLLPGCALAILGSNLSYGFPHYTITRIAPVSPYENAGCEGMAPNAGYVVGIQLLNPPGSGSIQASYLWQASEPLVELPLLDENWWNHAYGVNDFGQVVGYSAGYNASLGKAWRWDGSDVILLDNPANEYLTCANGINNKGLIVGRRLSQLDGSKAAVLWDNGQMKLVGTGQTKLGRRLTAAWGVNDQGQVVGITDDPVRPNLSHAFSWDGDPAGDAVDLPELPFSRTTQAVAINEQGQAVGTDLRMNWASHAVFWDVDHSIQVIPPPPGARQSGVGEAINDAGWVVGENGAPWVWNKDEGTVWLRSLLVGPDLDQWRFIDSSAGAMGIDNEGRIAGQAIYNGQIAAFLLTPVELVPTEITIDIKPGAYPNTVNPKSQGTIPVAILSTEDFDAPGQIDPASLTFGRTGSENSLAFCNPQGQDVNGDGRLDLFCHFRTEDAGFECGDTEGVVRGATVDGRLVQGRDSVLIIQCKR